MSKTDYEKVMQQVLTGTDMNAICEAIAQKVPRDCEHMRQLFPGAKAVLDEIEKRVGEALRRGDLDEAKAIIMENDHLRMIDWLSKRPSVEGQS